ncbi:MAG: hypothetical protein IJY81_06715, partial [Lachnospiraceae bacterium]|nr:hypothetical protein [Lachnospiraceae bacterium]
DPTKPYILINNQDIVYFEILLPHQAFEKACPNQVWGYESTEQDSETGEIVIKLAPNDTRRLAPGIYYYTVKLQRGGTLNIIDDLDEPIEVRTIIERTKFIINE